MHTHIVLCNHAHTQAIIGPVNLDRKFSPGKGRYHGEIVQPFLALAPPRNHALTPSSTAYT